MEQETLVYIEEKDKEEASKLSRGFTIPDTMKRVYINALGSELAMKYLAQENISVANIYNLHNIHKLREEFDIADVMLPNIHIDVRTVYDKDCIFVPKAHFEYGLTPDIYLVFQLDEDMSCAKFLGFFEPKLINKNNQNKDYYFIEKEKLSHPSDLKKYIKDFKGNTTEALTENELSRGQEFAMAMIDHDITNDDKKSLIKLLLKSSTLREDLIEFDNFEWLSYHVATSDDVDLIPSSITDSEENNENPLDDIEQPDEFDIFDQNDEFQDDLEELGENNEIDELMNDAPSEDLLETVSDTQTPDENLSGDELTENNENLQDSTLDNIDLDDSLLEPDTLQIDDLEDLTENLGEIDTISNDSEDSTQELSELDSDDIENVDNTSEETPTDKSTDDDLITDDAMADLPTFDDIGELNINDSTLTDLSDDLNLDDNIEDAPVEADEKIHLSEFSELPFDTKDSKESSENDEASEEIYNLDADSEVETNSTEIDLDNSTITTNFDDLGERDDIKPVDEAPFKDDEIKSIDDIDQVGIGDDETSEAPHEIETTNLDSMEMPKEKMVSDDTTEEAPIEKVSFNDLDKLFTDEMTSDENEPAEVEEQPVTMDDLINVKPKEDENTGDDDFLETLAENTPQETEENSSDEIVSYENTNKITNENITPGEISIDINQVDTPETPESEDDIEKLEVLYNNTTTDKVSDELGLNSTAPEKGKKAVIIASTIVVALAGLLVYASINKTNNQTANQASTNNVLENNLPKLDEQKIPEESAIIPEKPVQKETLENTTQKVAQNVNKKNAPLVDAPYLDVKKLSWSVPDYVSYNDDFRKYLQTAGKSLKLSLSSDLLLATEYAYSDQIQVNVVLSKEGVIQDAKILQSSGSTQIDQIVLRTVNDTLKVVKAPAGVIVGDSIQLTLKIYI